MNYELLYLSRDKKMHYVEQGHTEALCGKQPSKRRGWQKLLPLITPPLHVHTVQSEGG
jgi:hypothetical protein